MQDCEIASRTDGRHMREGARARVRDAGLLLGVSGACHAFRVTRAGLSDGLLLFASLEPLVPGQASIILSPFVAPPPAGKADLDSRRADLQYPSTSGAVCACHSLFSVYHPALRQYQRKPHARLMASHRHGRHATHQTKLEALLYTRRNHEDTSELPL